MERRVRLTNRSRADRLTPPVAYRRAAPSTKCGLLENCPSPHPCGWDLIHSMVAVPLPPLTVIITLGTHNWRTTHPIDTAYRQEEDRK
jgi:hypothetical protein